jgi:hypothetical protein
MRLLVVLLKVTCGTSLLASLLLDAYGHRLRIFFVENERLMIIAIQLVRNVGLFAFVSSSGICHPATDESGENCLKQLT